MAVRGLCSLDEAVLEAESARQLAFSEAPTRRDVNALPPPAPSTEPIEASATSK